MIVKTFALVQSPFDTFYTNVPDVSTWENGNLHESLMNYFSENCEYFVDRAQNISVPLNFNTTVTIANLNIQDEKEIHKYNYIILYDKDIDEPSINYLRDKENSAYYFITDFRINNNVNGNMSVTFSLVKDVWLTNFDDISFYLANKKFFTHRRHQKMFLNEEITFAVNPAYRPCNKQRELKVKKSFIGNINKVDILWLRVKLDPLHSYFVRAEDESGGEAYIQKSVDTFCKEYGLLKYFFIPFQAYYKGTTIPIPDFKLYMYGSSGAYYSVDMFGNVAETSYYNIGSPYIVDMDFTFYPPFELGRYNNGNWGVYNADYISGGSLYDEDQEYNVAIIKKYGFACYGYTQYEDLIKYENSSELYIIDGSVPQSLSQKSLRTYSLIYNDNGIFDEIYSDEDLQLLFEKMPCFSRYPYQYVSINYPTRQNHLYTDWLRYNFTVKIYPKDTGTRYEIEFEEVGRINGRNVEIPRLQLGHSNEGFDGTGSLPITTDQYDIFRSTNGSRYDVSYAAKTERRNLAYNYEMISNISGIGQGIGNIAFGAAQVGTGNIKGVGNILNGAFGAVDSGVAIAQSIQTKNLEENIQAREKNAMVSDLQNQCSQVGNVVSNAIVDTIFQDRCMIIFNEVVYEPSVSEYIMDKYYYGDSVMEYTDLTENNKRYYDYISANNVDLSFITNLGERTILASIFNNCTRWHVDRLETNILNKNVYNLEDYEL